jgi:uncharacterized glyoxalase superfamily protein PhnB
VPKAQNVKKQMIAMSPYFLVADVYKTAEFYRDTLGFSFEQFWGNPPDFVIVSRDDIQIMFRQIDAKSQLHKPNRKLARIAFDAYIYVNDVDALFEELKAKDAKILQTPIDREHDCREIEVEDCNGRILCFGQDLLDK